MVNMPTVVTEPQVLLATSDWLLERQILPLVYSVSGGSPDEREALKTDIRHRYEKAYNLLGKPVPEIFSRGGPDIEAVSIKTDSAPEWWRIECKGAGKGVRPTQISKFNDARAATVSYYTNRSEDFAAKPKDRKLFPGLALPDTGAYMHELTRKVRKPLRKRLNLWVLLFEIGPGKIRAIPPDEDIA